ncbi:MAG: hypothetical protein AB8G86_06500 [Saprospiraceae bacterium]
MKFNKYENLNNAKKAIFKRGYREVFDVKNNRIINQKNKKSYLPNAVEIVEYHRFHNIKNTNQNCLVLVVECKDKVKGIIISTYGEYMDMQLIKFMNKAKIKSRVVTTTSS